MGFTRSTTDVNVHRNMPDYPSGEGYTTEQLKTAFDSSAAGLKADLNGLMTELENTNSAENLGAAIVGENDITEPNVQAKLNYLMGEIQGVALGDIPDGTITQAKMDATYEGTLAKKDETLQEGLNSEMLGGTDLATIMAAINECKYVTGSYTIYYGAGDTTSLTLNLGFRPKCVLFVNSYANWNNQGGCYVFGVVIDTWARIVDYKGSSDGYDRFVNKTATLTDTGISIPGFNISSYSTTTRVAHTGRYIAFR